MSENKTYHCLGEQQNTHRYQNTRGLIVIFITPAQGRHRGPLRPKLPNRGFYGLGTSSSNFGARHKEHPPRTPHAHKDLGTCGVTRVRCCWMARKPHGSPNLQLALVHSRSEGDRPHRRKKDKSKTTTPSTNTLIYTYAEARADILLATWTHLSRRGGRRRRRR